MLKMSSGDNNYCQQDRRKLIVFCGLYFITNNKFDL